MEFVLNAYLNLNNSSDEIVDYAKSLKLNEGNLIELRNKIIDYVKHGPDFIKKYEFVVITTDILDKVFNTNIEHNIDFILQSAIEKQVYNIQDLMVYNINMIKHIHTLCPDAKNAIMFYEIDYDPNITYADVYNELYSMKTDRQDIGFMMLCGYLKFIHCAMEKTLFALVDDELTMKKEKMKKMDE